jgi:hypothetical protein
VKKQLSVAFLLAVMSASVSAQSIGVSPSEANFGTVERGETVSTNVYLSVSGQETRFVTRPEYSPVSTPFIKDLELDTAPNYTHEEVSMEDWSAWLDFPRSEVVIDPSTTLSADGRAFQGRIPIRISVPQNAEPGWHIARLNINPRLAEGAEGTGVGVKAVVTPIVAVRVPGEVEREFELVSSRGIRTGTDEALVRINVRNTGTVTSNLRNTRFSVVSQSDGSTAQTNPTSGVTLSPGEQQALEAYWSAQDLPAGNYRAQAAVGYMTGSFFVDEQVQITDFIQENVNVESPEGNRTGSLGEPGGDATWIILLVLVLLAVVLYSFDMDPTWIIAISSIMGLTFLALTGGLPIWVPLVAGAAGVVVLYLL